MTLVRVPRLWKMRYSYPEWRSLPENISLSEEEAIELYKHELRRWDAYEEELRNQYMNRQADLVNQIQQLDSYIFDTLTAEDNRIVDPFYVVEEGGGYNTLRHLRDSAIKEFITENGVYLLLEDGNIIGPYIGFESGNLQADAKPTGPQ